MMDGLQSIILSIDISTTKRLARYRDSPSRLEAALSPLAPWRKQAIARLRRDIVADEAINTLPVIDAWANAPWMQDPLAWAHKLAEGTGKRNDLIATSAA